MFQRALRLRRVEMEQDSDASRHPAGDGDFRCAQQGDAGPSEAASRAGGVLGGEIWG